MAICAALDLACVNVVLLVWVDIFALFNIFYGFTLFHFLLLFAQLVLFSSARKPLKTRKQKPADFFVPPL